MYLIHKVSKRIYPLNLRRMSCTARTPQLLWIAANHIAPTHSLADRLPYELLQCIFKICVLVREPTPLWWITVTHVCRSWRDVALSCASLWTDISVAHGISLDLINAFLTRSQQSPLSVTVPPCSFALVSKKVVVDELSTQMSLVMGSSIDRIHRLSVFLDGETFLDILKRLGGSISMPNASILHLDLEGLLTARTKSIVHMLDAPNLTKLAIHPCPAVFRRLSAFPHLKVLEISPSFSQCMSAPGPLPLHLLLSSLAKLAALEGLSIDYCDWETQASLGTFVLPQLKKLVLSGAPVHCSLLLKHVLFPASTTVTFADSCTRFRAPWEVVLDRHATRSILATMAGSGRIGTLPPRRFNLKMGIFDAKIRLNSSVVEGGFALMLPEDPDRYAALRDLLPWHEAVHLTLVQEGTSSPCLDDIISRMINLEVLWLNPGDMDGLSWLLDPSSFAAGQYPLSSLKELVLGDPGAKPGSDPIGDFKGDRAMFVFSLLRRRYGTGQALTRLQLVGDCGFSDEELGLLEEVADEFVTSALQTPRLQQAETSSEIDEADADENEADI